MLKKMKQKLKLNPTLFSLILLMSTNPTAHAEDGLSSDPFARCEEIKISQDFESQFDKIKKGLEQDYSQGPARTLRNRIIKIRSRFDDLSVESYNLAKKDPLEIQNFVNKTVTALDQLIEIMPKVSQLAPKVRQDYVIPLANMNSLQAEYQDCMIEATIETARNNIETESDNDDFLEDRENTYQKLTQEMNTLNNQLYKMEMANIQHIADYRVTILDQLKQFNDSGQAHELEAHISKELPSLFNTVHREIEDVLPGLELSKKYYSLR